MITREKLKLFQKYGGDLDHWSRMNGSKEPILSYEEWIELERIMQDLVIIRNGLAADSYAKAVEDKLRGLCDIEITISLIKQHVSFR